MGDSLQKFMAKQFGKISFVPLTVFSLFFITACGGSSSSGGNGGVVKQQPIAVAGNDVTVTVG